MLNHVTLSHLVVSTCSVCTAIEVCFCEVVGEGGVTAVVAVFGGIVPIVVCMANRMFFKASFVPGLRLSR